MRNVEPFVRVAEAGSFRGAARRLGVSPAAVSKAVARLEEELGIRLFERTSRRVELTPEGRSLLPHARAALDHLQAGLDEVARARGSVQGQLRLALPFLLGPPVVERLPDLQARHPRLTFEIRVSDEWIDLAAHDVDVALRIGELPTDADLVARPLARPRWATVASPAYLGRHGTPATIDDLQRHPCGVFRTPRGTPATWQFRSGEVQVPATFVVDQGELLVQAAIGGLCLVQAFAWMVARPLADGSLVEVLPQLSTAGPPVSAVHLPRRRNVPRVRAFVEFVRDRLHLP
ncbi:MAG: LysR family transcriptional regulator [Myxococcota bacterium]